WAWPLVAGDGCAPPRTLALHLELAPPAVGLRRAERAVLARAGEEATRARWGFRTGARRTQEAEAALEREAELAAGFADTRFALVVDVAAPDVERLEAACRQVRGQAAQTHVQLRRLWGQQPQALVATLP